LPKEWLDMKPTQNIKMVVLRNTDQIYKDIETRFMTEVYDYHTLFTIYYDWRWNSIRIQLLMPLLHSYTRNNYDNAMENISLELFKITWFYLFCIVVLLLSINAR